MLLAMLRVSPLSIVSVPTVTLISKVTTEATAFPSSMQTFVLALFGTAPVLHIAALLQLPVPPSQLVVVPVHAVGGSPGPEAWAFNLSPLPPAAALPLMFTPIIFAVNAPPATWSAASEGCINFAAGKSVDVVKPAR